MDENAHLRAIFQHINAILMEHAQKKLPELPATKSGVIEMRIANIGRNADRIQGIIDAYCERQAEMMQQLMREDRFLRFPLPKKRIRLWSRLRFQIALWKAIRTSLSCAQQDCERNLGRDDHA